MKHLLLSSVLAGAAALAAGFWWLEDPCETSQPPPVRTAQREPVEASPTAPATPPCAPPATSRRPLRVEAAAREEPAPSPSPASDPTTSLPKVATRSAAWEALRDEIDARLANLAGPRSRTNSVAFTDAVKRSGIEVARMMDSEVAELFDGYAQLAAWQAEEMSPWTREPAGTEDGIEHDLSAIEERYRLCEQDLLRSFVRQ